MQRAVVTTALLQQALTSCSDWKNKSLAPMWCFMAALMVAVAWLLPNHSQPWLSFHSDAWMAVALAIIAVVVIGKTRQLTFSGLDLVLALVALLPAAHHAIGLVPFAGEAWISTAYLLGLLVAVVIGRQWHGWRPVVMADILFGSVFIAAIVSVGMQLYQWAGLANERDVFDIWVVGLTQDRPYANLRQPNQAATLLLWALLGCGWLSYRGYLGRAVTALAAILLVLGVALTQSRTGLLSLFAIVVAAWWWRRLWPDRRAWLYAAGMIPVYLLSLLLIQWGNEVLLLDNSASMMVRTLQEPRPLLWRMVADAILQRPWLGYGWNEVLSAHLAVAEHHPGLSVLFAHAHNFVLDLVAWTGVPLGLTLTAVCGAWLWLALTRVQKPMHALYCMLLLTLAVHAMLELPLHYAYFLLPAGLAVGALSGDLKIWLLGPPSRAAWTTALVLLAAASLLLALILRDYFVVEASTVEVRLKMARIHSDTEVRPPSVLLLTQFSSVLDVSLLVPSPGRTPSELERARDVTASVINYRNLANLVPLLALNGHVPEARCWMAKAMVLVAPPSRPELLADWRRFQQFNPQLRGIEWTKPVEGAAACEAVRHSRLGPWSQLRW